MAFQTQEEDQEYIHTVQYYEMEKENKGKEIVDFRIIGRAII
jgi:hypothetical protein